MGGQLGEAGGVGGGKNKYKDTNWSSYLLEASIIGPVKLRGPKRHLTEIEVNLSTSDLYTNILFGAKYEIHRLAHDYTL